MGMPHQEGYLDDIHTVLKPVTRFCMPKLMGVEVQGYIRTLLMRSAGIQLEPFVYGRLCQLSVCIVIP